MSALIRSFRLSSVWSEVIPGMLDTSAPPAPSMSFLNSSIEYSKRFKIAMDGKDPLGFTPPWAGIPGHFFWQQYLPKQALNSVDPADAWNMLVPFRVTVPLTPTIAGKAVGSVEGYYYPFGVAAVVSILCSGSWTLDEAAKIAHSLKTGVLVVNRPAGPLQTTWHQLGVEALQWLREQVFGAPDAKGKERVPYTVFTFLKGSIPAGAVPADSEVLNALEIVTGWPANADNVSVPSLEKVRVTPLKGESKPAPAGPLGAVPLVYAHQRGRAIWFPSPLTLSGPKAHTLANLHRNQVQGAMQVDMLGGLTAAVLARLDGKPISSLYSTLKSCAKQAYKPLGLFFQGRNTYRSASLKQQIKENYLEDMNDLRKRLESLPPIA